MAAPRVLPILAGAALAAFVMVGVAYIGSREATKIEPGDAAPDLELPSLGGSALVRLSDYRGRPILLLMFHSAAPFSQRETPDLERLHRTLMRRGLAVIGVDVDADPDARDAFIRRYGVTFLVLLDPNAETVRRVYDARRFPQRYLIDSTGIVRQVWLGPVDWTAPAVRQQIDAVLQRQQAPS